MIKVFDFTKIETLREKLGLRQADMADIFGVSRVQYNKWVKGFEAGELPKIRDVNLKKIRDQLDVIVWVLREYGWPLEDSHLLSPEARLRALKRLMQQQP
jgi:transcriptional regulator with XRE-family HTH domain